MADRYADWKAPAQDGEVLLWPDNEALKTQVRGNHAMLGQGSARVQNIPISELRRHHRQWLGHDDARPLVATGHQAELFHPGVWVKLAAINSIARAVDGDAYHIAVDTDEPKHLHLKWPGAFEPLTDDPALLDARWSGLVAGPTPAHVAELQKQYASAARDWPFQSLMGRFLDLLRPLTLEQVPLPQMLVNATHQIDWELGLRHHSLLASPMWDSDAFLVMACHLLSRADTLARDYNAALATYRKKNGIRSPGRPMPDLAIQDERIEAPFWLDDLANGSRQRASVVRADGLWALQLPGGGTHAFDPAADGWEAAWELRQFLRSHHHRLSPRALTLTMFMRLLVVDGFIHGIGGGRYDQVLDDLIERHWSIPAPAFAVATATLYFPTAPVGERLCFQCIERNGHRLRHSALGDRKNAYLEQIQTLPRKSLQRRQVFNQMQADLRVAVAESPEIRQWEQSLQSAREREARDSVLFDRELFYAVQPIDRLKLLIDRCAMH